MTSTTERRNRTGAAFAPGNVVRKLPDWAILDSGAIYVVTEYGVSGAQEVNAEI